MPAAESRCSVAEFLFQDIDLAEAADVTLFMGELRAQKSVDTVVCGLGANDPGTEDEHVHIVMLDPLMRRVVVMAEAGADTANLVCGYAGAHTAAADENSSLGAAVQDSMPDFRGEIRIINRRSGVRANVENLVALLFEVLNNGLFQIVPCVVTADDNEHD